MVFVDTDYIQYSAFKCQLNQYPLLRAKLHQNRSIRDLFDLTEIAKDAAHTLFHYLFIGCFQIMPTNLESESDSRLAYYEKCLLIFCAAYACDIGGLRDLAKKEMNRCVNKLLLLELQQIMKKWSTKIPHTDEWLLDHIKHKVVESFLENDVQFKPGSSLIDNIGGNCVFDKAAIQSIAEIYHQKMVNDTQEKVEEWSIDDCKSEASIQF
jgi:hypothetical protein